MNSAKKLSNFVRTVRDRRAKNATKICFAHVPKCAGSTVVNAISQQVSFADKLLYGSFGINDKACTKAAQAFSEPKREVRKRVVAYALAEGKHRVISGHFHCSPGVVETFRQDWNFVTVLRNPVDRWVSAYVYDRFKTAERAKAELEVEAYLASERGRYSGMTYLSYFSDIPKDPSFSDYQPYVAEAEANLKNFALVGLFDEMEQFAAEFDKVSGHPLKMGHTNKTPKQSAKAEITNNEKLMEKIAEVCRPDMELYTSIVEWKQ